MSKIRVWIFRGLVGIAAGLMITSWLLPWWSCTIAQIGFSPVAQIYPYGLWLNMEEIGGYLDYLKGAEMPAFFAPLIWAYLGLCIALLLSSLFVKEKTFNLGKFRFSLPKVLIGGVGLSYIIVAVLAVIIAAIRTGAYFQTPLQGQFTINIGDPFVSSAFTSLEFGYWLACGVGPLLIVLALLRNKIIGKARLNS